MQANRRDGAYTALIRTFNSEATLGNTIAALRAQEVPPKQFVIVDSGSTDSTLDALPAGACVDRYAGERFNYASALNQGMARVATEFVLIISSHTSIMRPDATRYALDMLSHDEDLGAAYFVPEGRASDWSVKYVDKSSFDGFNGLSNTCAMVRTSLVLHRPFRPEVFSAEDQEWAAWFLAATPNGKIARITGGSVRYDNPRGDSMRKRLNDYVSIAYFVRRDLLSWRHIASLACTPFTPKESRRHGRLFAVRAALRLVLCKVVKPAYSSRYF